VRDDTMNDISQNDISHSGVSNSVHAPRRSTRWTTLGMLLTAAFAGALGWHWVSQSGLGSRDPLPMAWSQLLAERTLQAAAADSDESFAIATGQIDSDVEGLYIVDSITGELTCSVLNYRTGKFNAVFRANVKADLGGDAAKRPRYLITSGLINFPRGATQARPGNSVVYVLDATTGIYAAYGIPWRRELAATGRPQAGPLTLLDVGQSRTSALRE